MLGPSKGNQSLNPDFRDILSIFIGVEFDDAWTRRLETSIEDTSLPVLGRADLVRSKCAAGRPKDPAEFALLKEIEAPGPGNEQ